MFYLKYKDRIIMYNMTEKNIHIEDSYKIRDISEMKEILELIGSEALRCCIPYKRSISSWLREWKAHNYLYDMNYEKDRTGSVDLNEDESLIRRIGYFFLALFYRG